MTLLMAQHPNTNTVPPLCTVAQLAAGTCAPVQLGTRVRISNSDLAVGDLNCASGTGVNLILCEYDGTSWVQQGAGAASTPIPPLCTVAELAAGSCAPDVIGTWVRISNADVPTDTDCEVGTGTNEILCVFNGASWTGEKNVGGELLLSNVANARTMDNSNTWTTWVELFKALIDTDAAPNRYSIKATTSIDLGNNDLRSEVGYNPLRLAGAACGTGSELWPECTLRKDDLSAWDIQHYKMGENQTSGTFRLRSYGASQGDFTGVWLQQYALGGAGSGGDEGAVLLRTQQDDTYPASGWPHGTSLNTAINTLVGTQESVRVNPTTADAAKFIGEDSLLVFNDAALGNCEDVDSNGVVETGCYMDIDGAAGVAGVTAVSSSGGVWTVAQSGDVLSGVRYDTTIGFTGFCFALDQSTRSAFQGDPHVWWLPIIYGPTDSIDPYLAGGISVKDTFNNQTEVDDVDAACPGTGDCITVTAHPFGAATTVKHVHFSGTPPGGISATTAALAGYYIRVLDANTIAVYLTKASAVADTSRINLTDGAGATATVGTGASCFDPDGCSTTQLHTYYTSSIATGAGAIQGAPPTNYVPGKSTANYVTGAAADDALIVPCERVHYTDFGHDILGEPSQSGTLEIHLVNNAKRFRSIPTSTDFEFSYPPADPKTESFSIIQNGGRSNVGAIFTLQAGVSDNVAATRNQAIRVISRLAEGQAHTLMAGYYLENAVGTDSRGSAPSGFPTAAALFHNLAAEPDAQFVADAQVIAAQQFSTTEWGTTDSDALPYVGYFSGGEAVRLQYDSLEGLPRLERDGLECTSGTEIGKYCRSGADCGGGGACGAVTTPFNIMQLRNRAAQGIVMWADGGPTCENTCEDVGLTCVVATDIDAATNTSVACSVASDADPGHLCKCRGNQ